MAQTYATNVLMPRDQGVELSHNYLIFIQEKRISILL